MKSLSKFSFGGTALLGTTDNQPLEINVNARFIVRLLRCGCAWILPVEARRNKKEKGHCRGAPGLISRVVLGCLSARTSLCPDDEIDVAIENMKQGQELIDGCLIVLLI